MLPAIDLAYLGFAPGWTTILTSVFIFIILKRNGFQFCLLMEYICDGLGLSIVGFFIRILAIAFSLDNSRRRVQLAKFVSLRNEIERLVQRYQYLIENKEGPKRKCQKSNIHSPNEEQKWLSEIADSELQTLRYRVYKQIQSIEGSGNNFECGNDWYTNIYIRDYISDYKHIHGGLEREECVRRLGCCAASCGCCDRPRRYKSPRGSIMRLVRERYLGELAHCSVDCGCCIRRRGFDMTALEEEEEEMSAQPPWYLKQEAVIA